ncbi:hypothetical protein BU16DRAFT_173299 [Lophium mytilinum]|uniref:Uncharacterized protein n=1 Tax=Lophium mytilinum TaxID=390894 RepID=A0A6A6QAV0_9PEZI|nr:hypothetical protein BU16DRAFT_173299 [Lophium mytilinum]
MGGSVIIVDKPTGPDYCKRVVCSSRQLESIFSPSSTEHKSAIMLPTSRFLALLLGVLAFVFSTTYAAAVPNASRSDPEHGGHLVRVPMDGEDEIANTTTLESRISSLHGYIWKTECTGDYFIWRDVTTGCITYQSNGHQERMYSLYLERGCAVKFFEKLNCGSDSDAIAHLNWNTAGCFGWDLGFMSFYANC